MSSADDHIKQYEKNKALAQNSIFQDNKYNDWKITIIFYATMHLLDSTYPQYFTHNTHEVRKNFLGRTMPYKNIVDEYIELENLSRRSRYHCIPIEKDEVEQAEELMNCIEDFVESYKAS